LKKGKIGKRRPKLTFPFPLPLLKKKSAFSVEATPAAPTAMNENQPIIRVNSWLFLEKPDF
jgi:hypothetical protein